MERIKNSAMLTEWLNPKYLDDNILDQLANEFQHSDPFHHLVMDDFLQSEKLELLIDVLSEEEFEYKESDLFQLAQTPDFDDLETEFLVNFKDFLRSDDFIAIMSYITKTELSSDIDCLGNIYQDTDYLLCHDDKLIKRKIAYILYLTELTEEQGGGLHLFNTDTDNQPGEIVKKIYPKVNRLTFFRVTRQSFHEVGEILQEDTFRVSISGWFNNE